MTPTDRQDDHHFPTFVVGLSLGIVGALLLGTEEGRRVVKKIIDNIPEKYKQVSENFLHPEGEPHSPPTPIIEPLETPHHATFDFQNPDPVREAPPPPAPVIHPQHPL